MSARACALGACLLAGLLAAPAGAGEPQAEQNDLVTPAGRVFRALEVAPIAAEGAARSGTRVSYAAASRDEATLRRDAEALVAAVGPQLAAAGETSLVVRAIHGDSAREVAFTYSGGRYTKGPAGPWSPAGGAARPVAAGGAVRAGLDRTGAAAAAAVRWLVLLDDGRDEAAVFEASAAFREEIRATGQWRTLMEQRKAVRYPPRREERYRLQTLPAAGSGLRAWRIAVQFDTRSADGARFLERVTLIEEGGGWKVAGYGLRPVAGGDPSR